MRAAVYFDRDGVLVQTLGANARPPGTPAEVNIVDGADTVVAAVRRAGFAVAVATNQPDIARGVVTRGAVDAVNGLIGARLGLDTFLVCPHDNHDGCPCRKPRPGLITAHACANEVDLRRSWMIGDRWVDIDAGRAAGVGTILLEHPYSWRSTSAGGPPADLRPDHVVTRLIDVLKILGLDAI